MTRWPQRSTTRRGTAQLCVNWSDESQRKMTTKITLWGTHGRIYADRQEIQVYLRDTAPIPDGYQAGWNVRYTTDMTEATWFYLRGEEYCAQLDAFVQRARAGKTEGENDFASATVTDRVIAAIIDDAAREVVPDRLRTLQRGVQRGRSSSPA